MSVETDCKVNINYDLTGVRLVGGNHELLPEFKDSDSGSRMLSYLRAMEEVTNYARALGGHVLTADSPLPSSEEWPTYRLNHPRRNTDGFFDLLKQLQKPLDAEDRIKKVDARRLCSYDKQDFAGLYEELERGESFVFAYSRYSRGHAKYLIERTEQLDRVQGGVKRLARSNHMGHRVIDSFEVRPFIRTPSDRYTSYRLVTSAVGTLLAAGLIYSGHTEDADKVIENDRFDDAAEGVRSLKECFESPESPYFLASRDIRSNLSSGGGVIPLIGDIEPDSFTSEEKTILAAHNPTGIIGAIPRETRASAELIGKTCGPQVDLCLGIDYLQERDKQERMLMLEINAGPDSFTYNRCWLGGTAERSEAQFRQRQDALHHIALYTPRRRATAETTYQSM